MKKLNSFWILIAFISITNLAPGSAARANETNTRTESKYEKGETKQVERRTRRARRINYTIPTRARERNRSRIVTARGTATRTINGVTSSENFQTIVAPSHVANTISSHPTFAVYFPEAGGEFVVSLEQKEGRFNKTIWQQTLKADKAGIETITLPANKPGLSVGKDYRFSVQMVVNPNDRSQDVVAQVWLQRVELSPQTQAKINSIQDADERAIALAEEGVWFDAVEVLVQNQDRSSQELLATLLDQVGLEEVKN